MNEIAYLTEAVARAQPLRIREVDFHDPVVALRGDGWNCAMLCFGRLLRHGTLVIEPDQLPSDDPVSVQIVTDALWDLIGHSICYVCPSPRNPDDLILVLTDGYIIETATDGGIEPWTFSVADELFIGSGAH